MSSKKAIVYIYPHLDDAIISSACHIYKQVQDGYRVIIITVFTSPGENANENTKAHYIQRKREDSDSAKYLGSEIIHLDFTDAPYRDSGYVNFNTLLFHHQLPQNTINFADEIANKLYILFDLLNSFEIYFPLGIGGHIDHHIVFTCSLRPFMKKFKIYYYEDMPYGLVLGWISIRWNNLCAKPLNYLRVPYTKKKLTDHQLPFIDNYCYSTEDKALSCEKYKKEWDKAESCLNTSQWMLSPLEIFDKKCIEVSPELFKIKCKAIAKYSTECPALFGKDKKDIAKTLSMNSCNEYYWSKI